MPRGRPVAPIELSDPEQAELTQISRSRSLPSGLVQRVQIVLACAERLSNTAVAVRLSVSPASVGKWRKRYRDSGLEGLHDELRSGQPRTYDDERVATVINHALQMQPPDRTHWSTRSMAAHSGVSKSTVQRWFTLFGVQPHRQRTFKLSTDPFFIEKVRAHRGAVPVRGPGNRHGHGDHAVQTAPPTSGVPGFSAPHRRECPRRLGRAPDRRQLRPRTSMPG